MDLPTSSKLAAVLIVLLALHVDAQHVNIPGDFAQVKEKRTNSMMSEGQDKKETSVSVAQYS